jgi:hypothetical protein
MKDTTADDTFVIIEGLKVSRLRLEQFQRLSQTKPALVKEVGRPSQYLVLLEFKYPPSIDQQRLLINRLCNEYAEDYSGAEWQRVTGYLSVTLRPPKRHSDPDSRKNARCDLIKIMIQFLDELPKK